MQQELFIHPPQYQALLALIRQFNNIYIIGPSGCGKTTTVHHCLKDLNIPFKRINFLQCQNKTMLLETIAAQIQSLWNTEIKISKKFSELIIQLNDFIQQYSHSTVKRQGYIIIDAPEFPQVQFTYLCKLLQLSQIKSDYYQFNFIFICNQLPNTIQMPIAPLIVFQPLKEEDLVKLLVQFLRLNYVKLNDFQSVNYEYMDRLILELAKDTVITFIIVTNNLAQLKSIAWCLFENYVFPHLLLNKEQKMFKGEYNAAKDLLLVNPSAQISSTSFQQQMEIELEGRERNKIQKDQKKFVELKNAAQTLQDQQLKLPKIPALILLSTYYGCRNPEKTDRIIFKDKKKNKKTKSKEQLQIKKKISSHRMIAICQSLMSVLDIKEFQKEYKQFNQSVLFYQQIQHLVDQGYLIMHSSKDDNLNKVKFECTITEKQAYQLAETLNIKFYDFLYQN